MKIWNLEIAHIQHINLGKSNFKNINLKGMTENLKFIYKDDYLYSMLTDNMKKKKIK